jgi:hypothetical protein
MSFAITPTSPAEQAAVAEFLLQCYHLPPEATFVEPGLLRWKYFEPRPDWEGPRSYVLRQNAEIMAHGCVVPSRFRAGAREVRGIRVIDWAGSRRFPGGGVLMMRKFNEWSDIVMAVGGSPDTLRVLPKAGFEHRGDSAVYARVIRPWRQFRTDPFPRGWKTPLRLARSCLWTVTSRTAPAPRGWSLRELERFDDSVNAILDYVPRDTLQPVRSAGLLNYMLGCPGAAVRGFLIVENTTIRGYCLLSRPTGQARIAELRLASQDEAEWRTAYALAAEAAAADPLVCEILAVTPMKIAAQALEANGFRLRRIDPILIRDPRKCLEGMAPLNINMLEGDEAYVFDGNNPYVT